MIEWFQIAIEPHWPFLMAMVAFMVIGQVMKGSVFTRERAYAQYADELPRHVSHLPGTPRVLRKFRKFWWWTYKSLPLHPMLAGIALGMIIVEPEPGIVGPEASLYFATAGACSVFLYQVVKGLLKRKDIELSPLPGQSKSPAFQVPKPPKVPDVATVLQNLDDKDTE
jgi:hypothetical protein